MISNAAIAKTLRQIGFLMEMIEEEEKGREGKKNDVNIIFKIRAYKRTADAIATLSLNVEDIYSKEGLDGLIKIPSVGKAIASKIEEYITTGKIQYFEQLKSKTPINIEEFYRLEGIGPKTIKALYNSLKITSIYELERAASEGKVQTIPGFSQRKEKAILKRIQLFRKAIGRYLIGDIYPLVKEIEVRLSNVRGVKKAIAAGSFRRMKETVGDIDYIVASSTPQIVIDFFVKMPEVNEVLSTGASKIFVRLNNGMDADLLVVPEESFGSALQYFTGSKEHDVAMRKVALANGFRLNEWGVFDNNSKKKVVAGSTEEEVYHALGLDWIPPEMRENNGEIELAKERGNLPKLMQYDQLKGDLHVHSNNSDGIMSIENIALAAKEDFGFEYIALTDHTKNLRLARGLDEKQLLDQANRIGEINDKIKQNSVYMQEGNSYDDDGTNHHNYSSLPSNFRILSAAEVNIMKDGSLDIPNNVLDKLDIVGAAIHSNFGQPIEVQTNRLIQAAQNPSVDIIFHPTGRIINKREGYPINIEKLIDIAKETSTVLEVDAHYNRLDLKDDYIRMAVQNNVKLVINSDAHHSIHFAFLIFGIGQARRGWAKQSDILNTLSVDKMLNSLK
jgi:DNA polymerase (family 10)